MNVLQNLFEYSADNDADSPLGSFPRISSFRDIISIFNFGSDLFKVHLNGIESNISTDFFNEQIIKDYLIPYFKIEIYNQNLVQNDEVHTSKKRELSSFFINKAEKCLLHSAKCTKVASMYDFEGKIIPGTHAVDINFLYHKNDSTLVKEIEKLIEKYSVYKTVPYSDSFTINFLCSDQGYYTREIKVSRKKLTAWKPDDLTPLEKNYGAEFLNVHKKIMSFLESDDTGLIILHGEPGTGKTSYIRSLLGNLSKKSLYMAPNMVSRLSNPDFLSFMLENPNYVMIIEDAEQVVASRDGTDGSVANLLNMTSGFLGDAIRVKVICTFNTALKNIDSALLRKGRLVAEWEFCKLPVAHSQRLLRELGHDAIVRNPMTLAEIYNFDDGQVKSPEKSIGFK